MANHFTKCCDFCGRSIRMVEISAKSWMPYEIGTGGRHRCQGRHRSYSGPQRLEANLPPEPLDVGSKRRTSATVMTKAESAPFVYWIAFIVFLLIMWIKSIFGT